MENKADKKKVRTQRNNKVVRRMRKNSEPVLLTQEPLTIGQQLQLMRAVRGWSSSYLAELVDVDRSVIDRLEADAGNQSINLLMKVVSILGGVVFVGFAPASYIAPEGSEMGLMDVVPTITFMGANPFKARKTNAAKTSHP